MELLCVNTMTIANIREDGSLSSVSTGGGLVKGNTYITKSGVYKIGKKEVYFIEGLGPRLACRFVEVQDGLSKEEDSYMKKEIEEALEIKELI